MVDNNRRTKLLPRIIFGQLAVALLICFIALSTIAYAQGYRFDYKHWRFLRTGILVLNYSPNDATPVINNKKICIKYPCVLNLPAGRYDIKVTKDGFYDWSQTSKLDSESVNIFQNIILFKEQAIVTVLADSQKISQISLPVDTLAINVESKLIYNDNEIWVGDQLVTRLSSLIVRAIWYPDLTHIVYQQGNAIRVIEKSGRNDTLLVGLKQTEPTAFAIGNKGQELYFIDQNQYFEAIIR